MIMIVKSAVKQCGSNCGTQTARLIGLTSRGVYRKTPIIQWFKFDIISIYDDTFGTVAEESIAALTVVISIPTQNLYFV